MIDRQKRSTVANLCRMLMTASVLSAGICWYVGNQPTHAQTGPPPAPQVLYGITFLSNQLIRIDTTTGVGTLVGNLDSSMSPFGLGTRGGLLYTFDQTADRIRQLDPLTAHTVATFDIGISTTGEGGVAFRSDGIGFLSQTTGTLGGAPTGTLWSFNIASPTPSSTVIGTAGGLMPGMDALDFAADDTLYGLSQADDDGESSQHLYTINQSTGLTTFIGSTGVRDTASPIVAGLVFHPSNGAVYAAINDRLYTIDPTTGDATPVGAASIGFSGVSGLAFLESPSTSIEGQFTPTNPSFTFNFPTGEVIVTYDQVVVPFKQTWTSTERIPALESTRYAANPNFPVGTTCLAYDLDGNNQLNDPNDRCVRQDAGNAVVDDTDTGNPPRNCMFGGLCHYNGNVTIEMHHHPEPSTFNGFTPGMAKDQHFDESTGAAVGQDNVPDKDILIAYTPVNGHSGVGRTCCESDFQLIKMPTVNLGAENKTLSAFQFPLDVPRSFLEGFAITARLRLTEDPGGPTVLPGPTAIADAQLFATVARIIQVGGHNTGEIQSEVEFPLINESTSFRFVEQSPKSCGKGWTGICGDYVFVIDSRKLNIDWTETTTAYFKINAFGKLADGRKLPIREALFSIIRSN